MKRRRSTRKGDPPPQQSPDWGDSPGSHILAAIPDKKKLLPIGPLTPTFHPPPEYPATGAGLHIPGPRICDYIVEPMRMGGFWEIKAACHDDSFLPGHQHIDVVEKEPRHLKPAREFDKQFSGNGLDKEGGKLLGTSPEWPEERRVWRKLRKSLGRPARHDEVIAPKARRFSRPLFPTMSEGAGKRLRDAGWKSYEAKGDPKKPPAVKGNWERYGKIGWTGFPAHAGETRRAPGRIGPKKRKEKARRKPGQA